MVTIGIRAAPKAVTFAVYDTEEKKVINIEEIRIPAALTTPDALKYVRSNLLDVLREFKVEKAGIRATEPNSQNLSIDRIHVEGVIQEAFASSGLLGYYIGHISTISHRLGIPRTDFKPLVDGEKNFSIENWQGMSKEEREALLAAIGAANV
jgi:hypothetical protein